MQQMEENGKQPQDQKKKKKMKRKQAIYLKKNSEQ